VVGVKDGEDIMQKREKERGKAMNKDINKTLQALVPILQMNGEKVVSIEAVRNRYKYGTQSCWEEAAEITYENGCREYVNIECDSNLTAVRDVLAVIQGIKAPVDPFHIDAIERRIYEK